MVISPVEVTNPNGVVIDGVPAAQSADPAQPRLLPTLTVAIVISAAGTVGLGGALLAVEQNVWLFAAAGLFSLFAGGVFLGLREGDIEPLLGALLALCYFGIVAAVLFGGTLVEALPEPLPGLAIGDSTFYFVWPLLQVAAAVAGSVVGGWICGNGANAKNRGSHG